MTSRTSKIAVLTPALLLLLVSLSNCTANSLTGTDSSASSCDDTVSASADANVDANVRLLLQASADFKAIAKTERDAIFKACVGIATDLGGTDSWSAKGDSDDAVANGDHTGACDVASARITSIMEASANANFALVVTKGQCYPDFSAQAKCDAECNANATCDSGSVETRCTPGELSVKCDASCKVSGTCKGTPEKECNCMGKCESTCTGECKGTCTDEHGKKTENDPNCHGKCSASCHGKCKGECKIDEPEGVQCGADVRCKGECTGTVSEPKCESTFTPPKCTVDASCIESCSAKVVADAVCDPPSVDLLCDQSAGPDVAKLVATLRTNLPPLFAASETQGKLVHDAAVRLQASAEAVVKASGDLNAKSITCAGSAVKTSIDAAATLNVTVSGGASVTNTCSSHSS